MNRREAITLLGCAAAWWSLPARAQRPERLPTIGFLGGATPSAETQRTAAFVQRLRDLGWIEGRTVAIEYRWAEGHSTRLTEIAAEFVHLKVNVILATGTAPALVAKRATAAIPIVFAFAGDPLGTGLVASLTRPGGNVTGLSNEAADLDGKRIELLREIVPRLRRLGVLANVDYPAAALEMNEVQAAARTLGLEVVNFSSADPLMSSNRSRINTLALATRLPTIYVQREYVDAGGLISYGANFPDMFRRAAELVDEILRGAKPADIPVEEPTKFELVINLTTAKALGLTIPPTLLARADEVIE